MPLNSTQCLINLFPVSVMTLRKISFYSRNSDGCVHSMITAFYRIIKTLVLLFDCLLLGNCSWNLTKSKSLKGKLESFRSVLQRITWFT